IYGNPYLRNDAGQLIVDANGLPQADPDLRVLGHYTPDWTGGGNNHVRFGDFDLNILFDTQQGGDIYSVTHMFGRYSGVLAESLEGREVDWNNPGLVVQGVDANGSPNTKTVTARAYNHALYGIHEPHVFDASWIKLR